MKSGNERSVRRFKGWLSTTEQARFLDRALLESVENPGTPGHINVRMDHLARLALKELGYSLEENFKAVCYRNFFLEKPVVARVTWRGCGLNFSVSLVKTSIRLSLNRKSGPRD